MTDRRRHRLATRPRLPIWVLGLSCAALSLSGACGDSGSPPPPFSQAGGSGGSGGTGGAIGLGGMGGVAGSGGIGGAGSGATGGSGGPGGSAGMGGALGPCATNALCHSCPDSLLCNTDDNCAFSGYSCVASGCETHAGVAIKQCQPSRGGSCLDESECPNTSDYDCIPVGASGTSGKRCVRVTSGCTGPTEAYDCVPGFSCEAGVCVDRRVPCDGYTDCPKNHVCSTTLTASFCVRVFRSCHVDADCSGFGKYCADIDGDGSKECAGELGTSELACVNADCETSSPVCEAGASGTSAACGDHGLCLGTSDCDTGFTCVQLGQDGRKECVPNGTAGCTSSADCSVQQVCAAPRNGNDPPSCQAGTAP